MKTVYQDFDLSFNIHPVTKDFIMKTDAKALLQSVRTLVLTAEGEFLMSSNMVGGGIRKLLFESTSALLIFNLQKKIEEVIKREEPRVELLEVNVKRGNDMNSITAEIIFYWANNPEPIRDSIRLNRIR